MVIEKEIQITLKMLEVRAVEAEPTQVVPELGMESISGEMKVNLWSLMIKIGNFHNLNQLI